MEINSISRRKQLEELISFNQSINNEIENVTSMLGWTVESITNHDPPTYECPYNSGHRLGEKSLDKHLELCQWKAEGYSEFDVPLSEASLPPSTPSCIQFDEQLLDQLLQAAKNQNPSMNIGMGERLIPRTSNRLITDFTRDERRILYEHVIANTSKPEIGNDIGHLSNVTAKNQDEKEITFLEVLAQERNLKRRRAKHKGIHTNKKSYVEILKEVIDEQMMVYNEYIEQKCPHFENKKIIKVEEPFPNCMLDGNDSQDTIDRDDNVKNFKEDRHRSHKRSRSHRSREYRHKSKQKKRSRSKSRDKHRSRRDHHKKHRSFAPNN